MRERQKTQQPETTTSLNKEKKPLKVLTLPAEYFIYPRQNVRVGIRLPSYKDIQAALDCANHDVTQQKLTDEERNKELFSLALAKHLVGMCLTLPDDYTKGYFTMAGEECGAVLHPGSITKLYNELTSIYQTLPELREPLTDAGVDRLVFLYKSLPEENPLKKRLRIGFAFLLEMI